MENQQLIAHNETRTYEVDFYAERLLVIENHLGERFVALKPVVEALGLDWSTQLKRTRQSPVFGSTVVMMTTVAETCVVLSPTQVPESGQRCGHDDHTFSQRRQVVALPLNHLHGWLCTVNPTRAKPEIREKLVTYQKECYEVLASYFLKGQATNPRFHRPEFDRTKRIAGDQSMSMAPVAFSAISRAAERVPGPEVIDFVRKASTLCHLCLSAGQSKPDQQTQIDLLKLLLDTGSDLHKDEVAALTRTTAANATKLLTTLDKSGYTLVRNQQGNIIKA